MKDINRGAFRITEAARAQHETALAQAVSKVMLREGHLAKEIATVESNVRSLGVFVLTGVYVNGELHSFVKTEADLTNLKDVKTEWIQNNQCRELVGKIY